MRKKIIIISLVLLGLLVLSVVKSCHRVKPRHYTQLSTEQVSTTTSSSSQTASSSLPKAQEEAKGTLEASDDPLPQEEQEPIREAITIAFNYLQTQPQDLAGTVDNRLSITPQAMLQTIVTMLKAGYQVDITSLQAYTSDSENVYQFTINLIKEDSDPLTLAGNYVIGTNQCDIEALHGIPTGIQ
ncbi:TPA: hypothetical protein VCH52_001717 [Streptococcus pyogenes]|nr:hypothetical protein [Streptococcus pyogenes]